MRDAKYTEIPQGEDPSGPLPSLMEDDPKTNRGLVATIAIAWVVFTGFSVLSGQNLGWQWPLHAGPVTVYLYDLLLLSATTTILIKNRQRWQRGLVSSNVWVLQALLLYLGYQVFVLLPLAHAMTHNSLTVSIRDLSPRLSVLLIAFFYPIALADLPPRRLIKALDVAAVLVLLVAIVTFVAAGPTTYLVGGAVRLRELWGGSALLFGWLLFSRLFLHRLNALNSLAVLGGLVGIVLVNHRSTYVALLPALGVQMALYARSRKRTMIIGFLTFGGFMAVLVAPTVVRTSFFYSMGIFSGKTDVTTNDRIQTAGLAWDYFKAHPVGDFVLTRAYYLPGATTRDYGPHNFVLQILSTEGVVGALFYLILLAIVFRIVVKNRRRDIVSTTMGSYLVFYLVFCMFNANIYSMPNQTLFAAAVAIILRRNQDLADLRLSPAAGSSLD